MSLLARTGRPMDFRIFNWIPTVPSFQDMKVEFKNKNVSGWQCEWLDSKVQM